MSTQSVIEAESEDLDAFYGQGRALELWDDKEAWSVRASQEGSFYSDLLSRHNAASVFDVCAASGFHAFSLAAAGFSVAAADGYPPFVEAGLRNQKMFALSFPYIYCPWSSLSSLVNCREYDAVLCLGASLHHTGRTGVERLFADVHRLLREGGVFIVEQRNYERLLAEHMPGSTHPCGWRYEMEYTLDPHSMFFRLFDQRRGINVRFHATITLEAELLTIASASGYELLERFFDYGKASLRSEATWIQYIFRENREPPALRAG